MAMATNITLGILDGKGEKSTLNFYVPSTVSLGDMTQTAQQFAVLVDELIGGKITSITASYNVAVPGTVKSDPNPTSDVEEGALWLWDTAGGFNTRFRVPTFKEALIVPGTRVVDESDADVAALKSFMINGYTTSTPTLVTPSDYRDDDITALDAAYESFRASRGRP